MSDTENPGRSIYVVMGMNGQAYGDQQTWTVCYYRDEATAVARAGVAAQEATRLFRLQPDEARRMGNRFDRNWRDLWLGRDRDFGYYWVEEVQAG